jgi:hypothetical protein
VLLDGGGARSGDLPRRFEFLIFAISIFIRPLAWAANSHQNFP